jgi:ATP-dependent Clp protease ATP-binding subunit ClpX
LEKGDIMTRRKRPPHFCDFCQSSEEEVGRLVEGPGGPNVGRNSELVYICSKCLEVAQQEMKKSITQAPAKIPSPRELVSKLDQYIIGQVHPKMVLSVAVTNHYKRLIDENKQRSSR